LLKEWDRVRAAMVDQTLVELPTDPIDFAYAVDLEPEDWQADILASDAPRRIMNCARRTGKSTVLGLASIHRALTVPRSEVVIAAPSLDQAQVPFRMAVQFYRGMGRPIPAESEAQTMLRLMNGSSIRAIAAVERSKRGFQADLLCLEEVSRIPAEAIYGALLPSASRGTGHILAASTPNSKQGWFSDVWHGRDDLWHRVQVTIYESRYFIDNPEQVERIRAALPEWFWRQEYLCEFVESQMSMFSEALIERALELGEDVEALEDEW